MTKKKPEDARAIFARSLKLCADQLGSLETHIANNPLVTLDEEGDHKIDLEAVRAVRDLAGTVNSMTKTQESMNAKGMAQVGTMSLAEQFEVCMRFICDSLPIGYRQKAFDLIKPTLKKGAS